MKHTITGRLSVLEDDLLDLSEILGRLGDRDSPFPAFANEVTEPDQLQPILDYVWFVQATLRVLEAHVLDLLGDVSVTAGLAESAENAAKEADHDKPVG